MKVEIEEAKLIADQSDTDIILSLENNAADLPTVTAIIIFSTGIHL